MTGATISAPTPSGTGILRYNGDGYGDCELSVFEDCQVNGQPWATTDEGTGHPWPVLSGENGEYQILAGDSSALGADLDFMLNSASGVGLVPEQVWNYPDVPASPYGSDPATASIGFTDGQADGSAAPLTWAAGPAAAADLGPWRPGRLLEQPSIVADAVPESSPPAAAPLTVTAPLSVSRRERAGQPDPAHRDRERRDHDRDRHHLARARRWTSRSPGPRRARPRRRRRSRRPPRARPGRSRCR